MAEHQVAARRTGFAPVVLAGLAGAGLGAVAAAKPWFTAQVDLRLAPGVREPETQADMPLALALSLVVLAAWGVVLVARTRGRRIALALAVLAGLGVLASVVTATRTLPDQVREQLLGDLDGVEVAPTAWFFVAALCSVFAVVVAILGWRAAPGWPAMGAKYDAPTGAPAGEADLWKAFDAGNDPTAADEPRSP